MLCIPVFSTDDLLRAGVLLADSLVVFSSHTKQNEGVHEHLADADNATAVHHITRWVCPFISNL